MLYVVILYVFMVGAVSSSGTLRATKDKLLQMARLSATVGRQGEAAAIRTGFFKALHDIETSILRAEASTRVYRISTSRSSKLLVSLQNVVVSAARNGNYKLGREIFGYARFIQDTHSRSRSKKRHKRSSHDFINFIKDKIGDQTFNQFFSIDSGTSLTFVLDTTGSMAEDMEQVRGLVKELSKSNTQDEDLTSNFYTFLIAPFSDPEYGPVEAYSEKGEFLSALENLQVNGGGDCDEVVLKGIIEGLEMTEAYSPVFVFTDAGSKDQDQYDSVVSLAQMYSAPLFFFITQSDDCPQDTTPYQALAAETNGQVLTMEKSEIGKMGRYVRSMGIGTSLLVAGSDNTKGFQVDRRGTGKTQKIPFEVDETIADLMVSVSFNNPTGSSYLLTPTNVLVYPSFVSERSNMRLYEVKDPLPGTWTLKVIIDIWNEFTYTVNSVSATNLDFDFYLLSSSRGNDVPSDHAIPGTVMKLKLTVLGDTASINYGKSQLYFVDTDGNIISTVQRLKVSEETYNQYDGAFIVPTETFKLKLIGETQNGTPFTRTSHRTITPSLGILQPFYDDIKKKLVKPGSSGNFYFRFAHYAQRTTSFTLTFTNPSRILTTSSPKQLNDIRKKRSKLIRLSYNIPASTAEGTEFRITLVASSESGVTVRYVYSVLATQFATN